MAQGCPWLTHRQRTLFRKKYRRVLLVHVKDRSLYKAVMAQGMHSAANLDPETTERTCPHPFTLLLGLNRQIEPTYSRHTGAQSGMGALRASFYTKHWRKHLPYASFQTWSHLEIASFVETFSQLSVQRICNLRCFQSHSTYLS